MKRVHIFLIVLSALGIGGIVGFYFASHRYSHAITDTIALDEFNRAADVFTTLHDLRAGDTNKVFDSLDSDLDSSVISLRGILEDYPTVEHATNYTNLLRKISDYRVAHPYHDDINNMDASVIQILAGVKKEGH